MRTNRNRDAYIAAGLFALALLLGGWAGFEVLQTSNRAAAEESPSNLPLPSITGVVDATLEVPTTFIATKPPITTRDPVEATRIADLTDRLQEAFQLSPTPSPECESIQIDLSDGQVFHFTLETPKTVWYGANEGTNPAFGPIIDNEFIFEGKTYKSFALPHNSFFVFDYDFKFPPGDYEISLKKWENDLNMSFTEASYELRICP